ncbi:putative ribonuclease H-like domain-containing protein [Tanacetum coccineum]
MAKQAELNKRMCKVLTRTGRIPVNTARASSTNNVNTARHNFNSQAAPTNAARKVNTVKPIVNNLRPKIVFHKTQSPIRRPFYRTTAPRTKFSNQKVNTAEDVPHKALENKGIVDSGCSRHMTGNKAYLAEYQDYNGGPVAFGGSKGYITGKGKIKTGKLDFEDVCFVKELQHFNLFSVSQMCDKKNKVLFTDTECLVLSPDFKLPDENQVLLRVPRQNNMYSFNLENIVPSRGLACLIAKATVDESNKWHRRLGHVNFKNLNKLVKKNLVRGLPSNIFQNDHTYVACQKGKQHKASCKAKLVSFISQPLQLLHMDLFGPTFIRSLNHKIYFLVITNDFSRFSWVFFLRTKDETSGILKDFIRQIENQLNKKVKTIRCDNGTEFKNRDMIEFCGSKGIKREYSNARTLQQNEVAERKNRTLIEAARTMLADSFLPNTFWAEAVSTACYVLNRVLVTKPQNKTPYELITGKIPIISYIRPFGCHVTILNTIDHLGKLDGKYDEGFLVGYSLNSKAFRPVRSENQAYKNAGPKEANHSAGTQDNIDAENSEMEAESAQDYFVLPIWSSYTSTVKSSEAKNEGLKVKKRKLEFAQDNEDLLLQAGATRASSTNIVNTASTPVSTASPSGGLSYTDLTNSDQDDTQIPALEDSYDNPNDDSEDCLMGRRQLEQNGFTEIKRMKEVLIEAIGIFLAFASYMGFIVYQMNVKSAFLYGKIDEEVMSQPPGIVDTYSVHNKSRYRRGTIDKTLFIKKDKNDIILVQVYVDDIIFGSTKRSWCDEFEALMKNRFRMKILKKFDFASVKTASTPIETQKPLVKDEEATNVDIHLYRFMIGSLMYLTASRPDIMFAVCACSRFQVTPKTSLLNAVKRIFRYLKDKPKLGLWYPRVSSFDLEAYSDSDYAGANLDRKSTTGGCQFLGRRLISWQCKKQKIVATSTTEAEYVAAANCCGQVLWIQNQMLDYGLNFMNTKIYIDNESTICIVKNPVFNSKTKHIEIRHHFIRDAYEKKLIQVLKIHTDDNVADLLTKAFDVSSLYGMFCEQKNLDNGDVFHRVIWVLDSN